MKRVSIVVDHVGEIIHSVRKLTGQQVLVGIPEATTDDREVEQEGITNAALGYIHEFGSPLANIPARPFLIPGVQKSAPRSTEALGKAAEAALDGNPAQAKKMLNVAGLIASNAAKDEIQTAPFVPLKPQSVRSRRRSRQTQSMRANEKAYFAHLAQGMSPEAAQEAAGIQPLINTGALRNSLTYVVREKS